MRARHAFGRRREVREPPEEPLSAPAEPTVDLEPVDVVPSRSRRWRGLGESRRPTPVGMFAIGFLFLLAGVTAVGFAQFTASRLAPWLSIGFSAAAAICTGVALVLARER